MPSRRLKPTLVRGLRVADDNMEGRKWKNLGSRCQDVNLMVETAFSMAKNAGSLLRVHREKGLR